MENINLIRSSIFLCFLLILNIFQLIIPSRPFSKDRWQYMLSNLFLVSLNNLLISFIPFIPYSMAVIVANGQIGLLTMISLPNTLTIIIGFLLLDVTIYFQHRLFHKLNFLWRLHSMHHIDPMLDATSGLRFHPLEILISNFIKVAAVLIFGITPLTMVIFEISLNSLAMFNHSNIHLHPKLEKIVNKVLITPALHTIHHSTIMKETNSNYGFSLPWWDKLFGTYLSHGKYSQENISIGTFPMPDKKYQLFPGMLLQPFLRTD